MSDETVEACEPSEDDIAQEVLDLEMQRRLWVRTLIPVVQGRSHDSDPSARCQLASDLMHIAVCERLARICQSDLPKASLDTA